MVTLVFGLEAFGIDPKEFAMDMQYVAAARFFTYWSRKKEIKKGEKKKMKKEEIDCATHAHTKEKNGYINDS